MSKMSKAIAVLGVVAGLGVAALPLSTYAAPGDEGTYSQSTSVQVQTKVEGAISISTNIDTIGAGTDQKYIDLGELMPGGVTNEMTDALEVTVNSNEKAVDYNLYINGLNGETAMKGLTTGATIPTGTNIVAGTSAWGYATDADSYAAYKEIPATATKVNTAALTTAQDGGTGDFTKTSNFKFKASASNNQTPDTYQGTVVFTATVE